MLRHRFPTELKIRPGYNDKYFYGDKIKCKENIIINKEFNWAWVAFILLGVVAVGIIIVVIYTKFIKKRKK